MKAYQAYSNHGRVTADTAKQAANLFFATFPKARKCDVIEGKVEGSFFVVAYGRASEGKWPESFKGVTKKTVEELK
jgi:hypothetical protein